MDSDILVSEPDSVILQPTTLCNLDCSYCYLPFRRRRLIMNREVADAVAVSIEPWTENRTVEVCWHGGEPLTLGPARLGALMDAFAGMAVAHGIQTNATLITDEWCRFFREREVRVGVSIDGPAEDNQHRVDLAGKEVFARIVRGINTLTRQGHEVSIIAVVSDPTPARARRLYEFAAELGAAWLGVNIEEQEGVNTHGNQHHAADVEDFWAALAAAWTADPQVRLRELDRVLTYAHGLDRSDRTTAAQVDPLPTVAYDGSVTLISPELAGFSSPRLGEFACGNVLHTRLDELIEAGSRAAWVQEYLVGLRRCRNTCPYFDFCGGGQPANRFFEHERFDGTRTNYCVNSKITLVEGVLRHAHAA